VGEIELGLSFRQRCIQCKARLPWGNATSRDKINCGPRLKPLKLHLGKTFLIIHYPVVQVSLYCEHVRLNQIIKITSNDQGSWYW
jgi:hypothetical protein